MRPRIESGQLCTVEPVTIAQIAVGDVVLCKVGGSQFLHCVRAKNGDRVQIANNRGRINGWVGANGVFGRVTRVEP